MENKLEIFIRPEKRKWQLRIDALIEDGFFVQIGKNMDGDYVLQNLGMPEGVNNVDTGYAE